MFCRLKPLKFKKVPDQIKSLVNLEELPSCKVLTVGVKVQWWGLTAAGLKGNISDLTGHFQEYFLFSPNKQQRRGGVFDRNGARLKAFLKEFAVSVKNVSSLIFWSKGCDGKQSFDEQSHGMDFTEAMFVQSFGHSLGILVHVLALVKISRLSFETNLYFLPALRSFVLWYLLIAERAVAASYWDIFSNIPAQPFVERPLQPRSVTFPAVWVYRSYFLASRRRPGGVVLTK